MKRTPLRSDPAKTRAWQQRSRKPIRRRKRINPFNVLRRLRMRGAHTYGDYHRYVSSLPCALKGRPGHMCVGWVKGHHVKTVGAGGRDYGNEIPLCLAAHNAIHAMGPRIFGAYWGVDPWKEAEWVRDCWEAL